MLKSELLKIKLEELAVLEIKSTRNIKEIAQDSQEYYKQRKLRKRA